MGYADDGLCHNSEPGTFNDECEKPAEWIGEMESGHRSGFCDECRHHGYEARGVIYWEKLERGQGKVIFIR